MPREADRGRLGRQGALRAGQRLPHLLRERLIDLVDPVQGPWGMENEARARRCATLEA